MNAATTNPVAPVLLRRASWRTYITLRDSEENRHLRMTFDEGSLELMSPSKSHERIGYLIGRCIDIWTTELGIDVQSCRTTTLRRKDLQRGLEADNCYYLEHEYLVRDREELDLMIDPPPDLSVEVDVTSASIDRMAIYSAFRVPEVWRWSNEIVAILFLDETGTYRESPASRALPGFPMDKVAELLRRRTTASETVLMREFQAWVRARVQG